MARKKTKMDFYDIINLSTAYHMTARGKITTKGGKTVKGTMYHFDRLTPADIKTIDSFKNTYIFTAKHKYAPEQAPAAALFVGERCFK